MSKGLLDPKVDFVFKNIFGSPNHPEILISFLMVLAPKSILAKSPLTSMIFPGKAKHIIELSCLLL